MKRIIIILNILIILFCIYNLYLIFNPSDSYEDIELIAETNNVDHNLLINSDIIRKMINTETEFIIEEQLPEYNRTYNWEELLNINSDLKGWLYVNDEINYPVVQRDNEYYINHNFNKEYDINGCLFFEKRINEETQNKIIHGHNMGWNKTVMFSKLEDYYNDKNYISNNPYIYYTPLNQNTIRYEIVAVLNMNINKIEQINYLKQNFVNKDDISTWIQTMKNNSQYYNENINIDETSEFITLSTCDRSIYGKNGRFVVIFQKID